VIDDNKLFNYILSSVQRFMKTLNLKRKRLVLKFISTH